jgi:hypothetical protein
MMTASESTTQRLLPGTKVVGILDGEAWSMREVCTFRQSGNGAHSYVVETAEGPEVWYASELFVPSVDQI